MEIRGPRTARCEIFPIGTVRSEILKSQNLTAPEPMKSNLAKTQTERYVDP